MISPNTIQQIQSQIDILDIVGHFVKLKKRGANYLGLCPFHHEKTPSFTVSPVKGIYKCFGCGKSGNGIGFLMDHEKYSYVEALRWLAAKYNIEIEETFSSEAAKQQYQIADSLYIINQFAADFFKHQLTESDEGQTIGMSYLKERGFTDATIQKFAIGYAPGDGRSFTEAALKAQYDKDFLLKTGLCVERNGQLFDNYRNRIVFPILNQSGKVIGFGARVIGSADRGPKYINTPENEIYVKSRILYGAYHARQAIDKNDECLLVEGYTDVVSLSQAGIENVVASGGTALTPDQLRLIKKFTNNLTIIYDGDSAGIKAALRGLDLAVEEGLNVQLVLIPDGEDPDSFVRKNGMDGLRQFIQHNKKDFIIFQLEMLLKDAGEDVRKKSDVVNRMADTISRLVRPEDFIRRQHYVTQVSQLLKIEEEGLLNLINKQVKEKINKFVNSSSNDQNFSSSIDIPLSETEVVENADLLQKDFKNEQAVLKALLEHGLKPMQGTTVAEYIFTDLELNDIDFENPQLHRIYTLYQDWYREGKQPQVEDFIYLEDRDISSMVIKLTEINYENLLSPKWAEIKPTDQLQEEVETLYLNEVDSSLIYLKLRKAKLRLNMLRDEIVNATTDDERLHLLQSYQALKAAEMEFTKKLGIVILK